ncbi:hypothetical protein BH11ARM2_BH11ARM2_07440 [soil metagenome]
MKGVILASLALVALVAAGCGSSSAQPVPTKDDFAKSKPPEGWRGPGQPDPGATAGGQGSNPGSGPPPGYKGAATTTTGG